MEYKCRYCGKICKNQNSLRNHERLCKLNPNHQEHTGFKHGWSKGLNKNTNESLKKMGEKLRSKYLKIFIPYCCEKCGKLVEHKYGSGRFCSRQCANSKCHTKEQKEKISHSLCKYYNNTVEAKRECIVCGKIFTRKRNKCGALSHSNTCSKECHKTLIIENGKNIQQKLIVEGKHKGWTTRNIESYAESFFKKVLENNNISYEFNKPIEKNKLGIQENGCYFLDFALSNKIDLEIDGKQHKLEDRRAHDKIRDERLTNNGWKVYRIEWKSLPKNNEYIKNEIDKFLEWYQKEGQVAQE